MSYTADFKNSLSSYSESPDVSEAKADTKAINKIGATFPNGQETLYLVLGRKGLTDIELREVHSNELMYRIRDTGRGFGSFSSKPDYEVYRPQAGDLFVGSIRLGTRSNKFSMILTNEKDKETGTITIQETTGPRSYVWKVMKSERKVVRDRWFETGDNGIGELMTKDEVIVLELVNSTDQNEDPICVVRLINTQPNGRFEVRAKEEWLDCGGSWNVLDELVVSAYANMEIARRKLNKGLDPSSFRFVGAV